MKNAQKKTYNNLRNGPGWISARVQSSDFSLIRLPKRLFFLMLLGIPCSFLSCFLFDFQIAQNVVTPIAESLHSKGFPVLLAQIFADFCAEIPDKSISIL